MTRRSLFRALAALLVIVASPSLPAAPGAAAEEARRGGTLTLSIPGSPRLLDPPITGSGEEWLITSWIYNNLTTVDRSLQVQPDLATSWESSRDGAVWTFHLHRGVKFHHGREMTAEDVVFSIERILNPETGSRGRGPLGPISRVEAVDRHTVRFTLSRPIADFPANLALPYARIIPKEKVKELSSGGYGTGPFKLEQFVAGERVTLVRNPDYFRAALPYLDRVVVQIYPDRYAELNALRTGVVDLMWQVRFEQVPLLERMESITVSDTATGAYTPIVMRADRSPFDNPLVRKALKLTLDRKQVVQTIVKGHGAVGNDQSLPPSNPFYREAAPPSRDIERAKRLLAQAGYPNGLDLKMYTSDARVGMLELALVTKEMARPAGFNIEVVKVPWDVFLNTVWEKETFYVNNWFARPTTDTSIFPFFASRDKGGTLNEYYYSNPEVDRLLIAAQGELDPKRRAQLYAEAQALISEDGPAVIPYFKSYISAYRKRVHGYSAHPLQYVPIERVWVTSR